ncbi:MAG: hypothetical protein EOR16_23075 [Mesorhizobium sp.]|uniref:hypothetical protein n=1 Tax=Mesorhizobium sp. TaxID=1871066 RepID=UPI000FE9906C|nr:hypothetical protein [Mesorhizobium sp.]RWI54689.1 MAG: hypothetical protein EOR16_23075 [Mesorhizobium sp.]
MPDVEGQIVWLPAARLVEHHYDAFSAELAHRPAEFDHNIRIGQSLPAVGFSDGRYVRDEHGRSGDLLQNGGGDFRHSGRVLRVVIYLGPLGIFKAKLFARRSDRSNKRLANEMPTGFGRVVVLQCSS